MLTDTQWINDMSSKTALVRCITESYHINNNDSFPKLTFINYQVNFGDSSLFVNAPKLETSLPVTEGIGLPWIPTRRRSL